MNGTMLNVVVAMIWAFVAGLQLGMGNDGLFLLNLGVAMMYLMLGLYEWRKMRISVKR